ncbi:CoA ester lyase [Bradyrhizobium sp. LLZ17]|uniref:CoA ester lyase n=1 Tax=Bradyrhizobium sp. LLZ17 TaxID=3239388 RepID=A0AB39XJ33_9BRAD
MANIDEVNSGSRIEIQSGNGARRPTVSLRSRLRACRSFLLTPGSRPERFASTPAFGGDAIIVDLESTVAPDDKRHARDAALAFFREPPAADFMRILRVNSPRSASGLRDLLALLEAGSQPDAVILPKCQSADEIRVVVDILDGSRIGIIPMVELARAVFVAELMADAHERVCGLFLGGGDLAADLGVEGTWENLLYARSKFVAAAASTGLAAIDVPYFKADEAGLRQEAMASRKLGMTGKAALHAEQLAVINTVFTPSPDAVSHARSVVAACNTAGRSAPVLAGQVLEPAMLREAERVLAIARKSHGVLQKPH